MFNLNCVLGLKLEIEIEIEIEIELEQEFFKNMVNTSHDKTVST